MSAHFLTADAQAVFVLLHISATLRRRDISVSRELLARCYGAALLGRTGESWRACNAIYNKLREPAGSLLFHVKQKSVNLPVVSCETAKYLMFHVKQL